MFEQASRLGLRFATTKGNLTVEDLWKLPLVSKVASVITLDSLAQEQYKVIKKASSESSFVLKTKHSVTPEQELKFEILKHIIDVKLAENAAAAEAKANKAAVQELAGLIDAKKKESLSNLSVNELEAMMARLNK